MVSSDKNGPPTSTDWWRECQSLRAENVNLKAQMDYSESVRTNLNQAFEQAQRENERLRTRNKTLEARLDQILILANLE